MVADAAGGGAAYDVVVDSEAGEHVQAIVAHSYREGDGQLAAGLAERAAHTGRQAQTIGGGVELSAGKVKNRALFQRRGLVNWSHRTVSPADHHRSRERRRGYTRGA